MTTGQTPDALSEAWRSDAPLKPIDFMGEFIPFKIYLAGPMRNHKDFNFPTFHRATAVLRSIGFHVFSPAENDESKFGAAAFKTETGDDTALAELAAKTGFTLRDALGDDTAWICKHADGIALLPGWRNSSGAMAEYTLAVALGLTIIELGREILK
jgi:nucleoside 2-deoxyribosyltransferase